VPVKELVFISTTSKFVKAESEEGRGPRNKFEFKYKFFKSAKDPN
jgi:hypothetical protein